MTDFSKANVGPRLATLLDIAFRELRNGLAGFRIFIVAVALGAAAIVGLGSISREFSEELTARARVILGGDLGISLPQRRLSSEELRWLRKRGTVNSTATMRAMASISSGQSILIDLLAVGSKWPSLGHVSTNPDTPLAALLSRNQGYYGLVAAPELSARLGIPHNGKVRIGGQNFILRANLTFEPDVLSQELELGPRVIISKTALRRTRLLEPGALVDWTYHVILNSRNSTISSAHLRSFIHEANSTFPKAGWQIRDRSNFSPQISFAVQYLSIFLNVIVVSSLLLSGITALNASRAYILKKAPHFAILRAIGASSFQVVFFALTQIVFMSTIGIAMGVATGVGLLFGFARSLHDLFGINISTQIYYSEISKGVLATFIFVFCPSANYLLSTLTLRPALVLQNHWPKGRFYDKRRPLFLLLVTVLLLVMTLFYLSNDVRVFGIFLLLIALVAGTGALMKLLAKLLAILAPRMPWVALREALFNLSRPNSVAPAMALTFGMLSALLTCISLIRSNLDSQLQQSSPRQAPSFIFMDIPAKDKFQIASLIAATSPGARVIETPILRGRLIKLNGIPVDKAVYDHRAAGVVNGDRGLTYSEYAPNSDDIVAGRWWPNDYVGPPLVSLDSQIAKKLNLRIGNSVTVNVLGREITAKIANLRKVDWRTLGIHFIFIFSSSTFVGAPHTLLAEVSFPNGLQAAAVASLLRKMANSYPTVSAIRIEEIIAQLTHLLSNVVIMVRAAAVFISLLSICSLSSTLVSSQAGRLYEVVIMKVLGATPHRLLAIFSIEYILIGAISLTIGWAAGGISAYCVTRLILRDGAFQWSWGAALPTGIGTILTAILIGTFFSGMVLRRKPATYLKDR